MIDRIIEVLLILLLVFTPIAFGSQELWAFSLMELGILLIIILWALKGIGDQLSVTRSQRSYRLSVNCSPKNSPVTNNQSQIRNPKSEIPRSPGSQITNNHVPTTTVLLSLFLGIVVLQMIPLPSGAVRIISPKTYDIRHQLSVKSTGLSYQSSVHSSDDKLRITNNESPATDNGSLITNPQSPITNNRSLVTTLSLFPMGTKIEFLKWLTLAGLFTFLLRWGLSDGGYRKTNRLIIAIFLVGVFESLYGIGEFFSGHRHILNLDWSAWISSVTGTFVNRNYFAGYLLMVIPLSIGYLFSREANQSGRFKGWRHWLSSLDGKMLLLGFGLILMILGLLLSASRMGILSLLISFSLICLFFRDPRRGREASRIPILIFGLALLWAIWIGLDAVIGRFFTVSEDLKSRWMLWGNTLRILKDFPFLGSGLGSFTQVFPMYRSFHIRGLITHAENDFLQLASEVGLCGAGLLLVLFLFLFFKATSGIRLLTSREPQKYIGIGCLVGILALTLHSIVERNVQVPANAFLFTVMWAMALRIGLHSEQAKVEVKAENWRIMKEGEVEAG